MTMRLENRTAHAAIWIPGRLKYPAHSLTIVIKGTYFLEAGGRLLPAPEPLPISPDIEAESGDGAVRYESDFAHFKPRADRLLVGRCHAPGGRPTKECTVAFSVGTWRRELRIIGDRMWKRGLLKTSASDPQPFTEMGLDWSRAYGGPRFAPNPAGRGFHRGSPEGDRELLLPNVEDPGRPIRSPSDPIAPAGFGPVARTWAPRRNMIGTYGKRWFQTRCPWVPEDIDWGVNNATPVASQVEGYLRGDEPLVFESLLASRPRVESRLPGVRARAIVERRRTDGLVLEEVALQLDTLWVDTEASQVVLVWRGACAAASEEYEDLETLFVCEEPLAATPASAEQIVREIRRSSVAAPAPEASPDAADEDEPQEDELSEEEGPDPAAQAEQEARLAESIRADQIKALRGALGRLPEGASASPEQKQAREEILAILARLESPEAVAPAPPTVEPRTPWTRERVVAALEAWRRSADLPPEDAIEFESPLVGADLAGLELSEIDFSGADLSQVRLDRARLRNARFAGCDLFEASAPQVDAEGADFREAKLNRANLHGATLSRARLEKCTLTNGDLAECDLRGASLEGADARRADLRQARIEGLDATGANLEGARLDGVQGSRACFEGAKLDEATLTGAVFSGGRFAGALVERAHLENVDLSQTDLTGASFAESDLRGAKLRAVRGDRVAFIKAILDGASLAESDLDGANLTRASLVGTDLAATSLRGANLRRVLAERTSFARADLFEALLPAARLWNVDFRGANLYGADLSDIDARELRVEGAMLKRTRLEDVRV